MGVNATLSQKTYLWANGTTVVIDTAYNNGVTWLESILLAHVTNAASGGASSDQHDTTHINVTANSVGIATASANSATTSAGMFSQLASRINAIEGSGAVTWGAGGTPSSIASLITLVGTPQSANTVSTIVKRDGSGNFAAGIITATLSGTATGFTTPQSFLTTIADYKATPGAAGLIHFAAGDGYSDSNGQYIAAAVALDVNLPTQPTGTHTQYAVYTKAPTTGTMTRTDGALDAALATIVIPTANKPVCAVLLRGATTNPGYILAASDILDIRFSGTGGGGSGGSSGVASSAALITDGNLTGTLANSISIQTYLAGTSVRGNPLTSVAPRANDATLHNAINNSVSGAYYGSLKASGAAITMTANADIFINNGGIQRVITAGTILTSQTGSAGTGGVGSGSGTANAIWKIYADFGVTGPLFALTLLSPNASPGNNNLVQVGLAIFDGTNFQSGSVIHTASPTFSGENVAPRRIYMPQTATANVTAAAGAVQVIPGTTAQDIYFGVPMIGEIWYELIFTQGNASVNDVYFGITDGGVSASGLGTVYVNPAELVASKVRWYGALVKFDNVYTLAAGKHSFSPYILATTVGNAMSVNAVKMHGTFWAAGS